MYPFLGSALASVASLQRRSEHPYFFLWQSGTKFRFGLVDLGGDPANVRHDVKSHSLHFVNAVIVGLPASMNFL